MSDAGAATLDRRSYTVPHRIGDAVVPLPDALLSEANASRGSPQPQAETTEIRENPNRSQGAGRDAAGLPPPGARADAGERRAPRSDGPRSLHAGQLPRPEHAG